MEKFNPSDERYKKVEDLPAEHQKEFVDVPVFAVDGGGYFLRKEAAEGFAQVAGDLQSAQNEYMYPKKDMEFGFLGELKSLIDDFGAGGYLNTGYFSGLERRIDKGFKKISALIKSDHAEALRLNEKYDKLNRDSLIAMKTLRDFEREELGMSDIETDTPGKV